MERLAQEATSQTDVFPLPLDQPTHAIREQDHSEHTRLLNQDIVFLKGVLTSFATQVQWKQVSCLLRFLTLIVQLTIVFMIPVPYQI